MKESAHQALLPAGLVDLLPPAADQEESIARSLMDRFASYGYQRVKPPLLEFETGLLNGIGATVAAQTFRLMDPVSQRMMGVRADITPQVARLAATRLGSAPRPVRVSYCGEVLRVRGSQLRPERQFRATGVELIGAAKAAMGDAEVILLAAEAVSELGADGLSVDINVPAMAHAVCAGLGVPAATEQRLRAALDRKDSAALLEIGGDAAPLLVDLLRAGGPAAAGLEALDGIELPGEAAALGRRLREVVELVAGAAPDLNLTIDPVESRGFEYHTGISFTLFAAAARAELGTGGRYLTGAGEPATGFTLFLNMLMKAVAPPPGKARIFVPYGVPIEDSRRLREAGWITVNGLIPDHEPHTEARRLECRHVWLDGAARAVAGAPDE